MQQRRSEHREWSTVVDISIPLPSFKPVSLFLARSPLSKIPKQVFFDPINIFDIFYTLYYYFIIYFFRLTSTFYIFTGVMISKILPQGPGKYSKRRRSNVAVIHVRIVFIGSFLFYCLLLNHSFPTNPNSITNCFKLFSLLQLYNYIAPASLFDF